MAIPELNKWSKTKSYSVISEQISVMIMTKRILMPLVILVSSGCASQVPILIKIPPNPDIEFHQVKENIITFQGSYVRWGGKIISIENKEDSTWIEILSSPLNSYGKPVSRSSYEGRFIARVDGFLDPKQYSEDRKLTIFGSIDTEFVKKIDEHPYSYPLVSVKEYYMWPEFRDYRYNDYYYYGYRYPFYRHHFGLYRYY